MKAIKLFFVAVCSVLLIASCEKKDSVKVESLTNTYWENVIDDYNYMKVWFYDGSKGKVSLRTSKSDEPTTSNVGYSVKQSGYVSITLFPGTSYEKEWISGTFNKDKGTLTLGSMKMTYKGKAQ